MLKAVLRAAWIFIAILLAYPAASSQAAGLNGRFGGTGRNLPASDVVGATAGEFGVSSSGVASYAIPITVPIGTTGVQPALSLNWSSQGTKGVMGLGGSIGGLSYITRCGGDLYQDGVVRGVDLSANDKFCLNGQRLVPISGSYGADGAEYRTSLEEFSKVISYGSAGTGPLWFKVWRKSGEILEYGATADARYVAIGRQDVRAWALNKLSDRFGNYVGYSYFQDASTGEFGISRIDYTGNVAQGLAPYNSVQFVYEAHPKPSVGDFAGQKYTQAKRLSHVKVFADANLYRDYTLAYLSANQLGSITECAATECFPPTMFQWASSEEPPAGTDPFTRTAVNALGGVTTWSGNGYDVAASGDFNGDGRVDLLLMWVGSAGQKTLGRFDDAVQPDIVLLGKADGSFQRVDLGANSSQYDYKVVAIGEFNGDGRTDLFLSKVDGNGRTVANSPNYTWLANADGTFTVVNALVQSSMASASVSTYFGQSSQTGSANGAGMRIGLNCFDGDGITDLYVMTTDEYGRKTESSDRLWLSNRDGTFRDVDLGAASAPPGYKIVAGGDFNGDSLPDLYMMKVDQKGHRRATVWSDGRNYSYDKLYLARGDGTFDIRNVGTLPTGSVTSGQECQTSGNGTFCVGIYTLSGDTLNGSNPVASGNFNRDGLTDLYWMSTDDWGRKSGASGDLVWLSKGNGDFEWVSVPAAQAMPEGMKTVASGDFNGDGLTDYYIMNTYTNGGNRKAYGAYQDQIWFSNGDGAFSHLTLAPSPYQDQFTGYSLLGPIPTMPGAGVSAAAFARVVASGDVAGNGAQSLYFVSTTLSNQHLSSGAGPDYVATIAPQLSELVTSITNGLGNKVQVQYKPLTDAAVYTKYTDAVYPVQDDGGAIYVVSKVIAENGIGGTNSQTYRYEGLKSHLLGLGSLGFAKTTITDDATGIVTESTISQDYAQRTEGLPTRSRTIAPNGTVLEDKTISWAVSWLTTTDGTKHLFRYSPQSSTQKRDLNGSDLGTITETATYDAYGFVTNQQVDTASGTSVFSKISVNTYNHDAANWILGRLTNATATHRAPGVVDLIRASSFTYNSATGMLTSETIEPGEALSTTKTYAHNGFGAVTSITESWNADSHILGASRTTSYVYDPRVRYRVSETNPLGQTQANVYDPMTGLLTQTTGPNGLSTSWSYTGFGLLRQETRADGAATKTYRYKCSTATVVCPANGAYVEVVVPDGGTASAIFKDKLNRTIRQSAESFDGRLIDVDTVYDAFGHVVKRSEPTFEGAGPLWTTASYDLLGRTTQTVKPDTKTDSMTYNGFVVTSVNGLGQTKTAVSDVMGRMVSSTDTTGNTVNYVYDAIGQLAVIYDPVGYQNRSIFNYDKFGHKTYAREPNKKAVIFSYNAFGLVSHQTDGKGQRTDMTYDVLGRMVSRTDDAAGANPQTSTWTYDVAPKGVGKLASESGYGYSASYAYDDLGRPASKSETIDGTTYTVSTTYDNLSRPLAVTYPTGLAVQTSYTAYGQASQIGNAATGTVYWRALAVDARGNVTGAQLGNGVEAQRSYDAATGHLTHINSFSAAAGTIQDLTYAFDTVGNLLQRSDARQGLNETFLYDNLNRVTSSTVQQGGTQTTVNVTYDRLGNITSKSDVGAYTYDRGASCATGFAGPHAVTSVAGAKTASYCYDLNGNLTSGDGRAVEWSAFGMPTKITQNLRSVEIAYGPNRARFKRIDQNETGTITTHYVAGGSHEVVLDGSASKRKTYVGGVLVVTETTFPTQSVDVQYLLHDHLGSTDVVTDASGQVAARYSFDAWGKRRDVSWTAYTPAVPGVLWQTAVTTRGYTGHEQLDQVGLVHMNGRVYDPELGRFLSADPFVQDPSNLQSLNRYSYVLNNPLSLTDPSGYFSWGGLWKSIGKFLSDAWHGFVNMMREGPRNAMFRTIVLIVVCATPGLNMACIPMAGALTLAAGGTMLQALQAMAFAYISQAVWVGVGQGLRAAGMAGDLVVKPLVHGVVGGALSLAQGGSFMQGFVSSAIGAGTGLLSSNITDNMLLDTMIVGAAGGLAAQLTGGKFANGAFTAAFANLYNKWGSCADKKLCDYRDQLLQTQTGRAMWNIVENASDTWNITWPHDGPDEMWGLPATIYKGLVRDIEWGEGNMKKFYYNAQNGGKFQYDNDDRFFRAFVHEVGHVVSIIQVGPWDAGAIGTPADAPAFDGAVWLENMVAREWNDMRGNEKMGPQRADHLMSPNP